MLDDYRTAPIGERLRAMLSFLEKLTLRPGEVGPADIAPLREVGLSDEAIREAMYVSTMFNVMDRFADAFDFELTPESKLPVLGLVLARLGYSPASVPG